MNSSKIFLFFLLRNEKKNDRMMMDA